MSTSRLLGRLLVLALTLAVGCGPAAECPAGYVRVGDLCNQVLADGGDAGIGPDGGGDGGREDGGPVDGGTVPDTGAADTGTAIDAGHDACVVSAETCNGLDDDCDGVADDELELIAYFDDLDGDGFGDDASPGTGCALPTGTTLVGGDCDDSELTTSPDAVEVCDGVDQDCDGTIDDGVTMTFYADVDGDGYGAAGTGADGCAPFAGHTTADATDCNDACVSCHPGGTELCDGLDQDCDAAIDDGVMLTFYPDYDGDGYGYPVPSVMACTAPSEHVLLSGDCNDGAPTRHPGAAEVCNHADDNCTGGIDEGLATMTYYVDADGDGYAANTTGSVTDCMATTGYTARMPAGASTRDCFDSEPRAFPGQTMFFATAIPGATTLRAYDFDCDGANLVRYGSGATCTGSSVDCNASGPLPAFVGPSVGCGDPGTLMTACGVRIIGGVLTCAPSSTPSTLQTCR